MSKPEECQKRCARQGCENFVTRKAHKHCSPECARAADAQTRLWVPKAGRAHEFVDLTKLKEELVADIKAAVKGRKIPHGAKPKKDADMMHMISLFDLHIGKYACKDETGENYDSKIATARLREAMEILLDRGSNYPVEQFLFPLGQDLLNIDNMMGGTTAGTLQDSDSRLRRIFRTAVLEMTWCIERMAEVAPVRVLVVPGNHDNFGSFAVGSVIEARFHGDPRVIVDPSIMPRVYYRYGKTLLGFNHGGGEDAKSSKLALVMATERPADWAATDFHEFYLGHRHIRSEERYTAGDTHGGVGIHVLPSLSGTDLWHSKNGYVDNGIKRSVSILFNKNDGPVVEFKAAIRA